MDKLKKKRLRRLAERKDRRRQEREERTPSFTGKIVITRAGYGFVTPNADEDEKGEPLQDIFIPPQFINGAFDGDVVRVQQLPPRPGIDNPDHGPAGRVVEIVEEARSHVVGELIAGHKVRPLNKRLPDEIEVAGSLHGAKRGDWVKLKLLRGGEPGQEYRGTMVESLGKAGSIKTDLDAVVAEYDLAPPYTAADDAEALAIVPREIERVDMRDRLTTTIDPIDAKDFDDAVSLAPGKDDTLLEVGVHIADVAAVIAPKSKFDVEAYRRSFTAYLPGRTLPMLPKSLTARISLHVGDDCPAHSVIFQIERATGRIVESKRCHTLIRIDHRLNYEEVQHYLDGKEPAADWSDALKKYLREMNEVTTLLRRNRERSENFLDLAMPEIRILCDEGADKINGLGRKIQRESEFLVEECMLAANSAVGEELPKIGVAGLYRVHPAPDPDKLDEFYAMMQEEFGIVPGDLTDRRNCRKFIDSLPDDPRKPVILSLFLRSLPRAYYFEKSELHFGLGKEHYSHFTSPIRRYPDLIVHQQLWSYDCKQRTKPASSLAVVAAECSQKEENNDNAYYAANERLKLRYLAEQLEAGKAGHYRAVIAKHTANGFMADIPELGMYGFIPFDNTGGARLHCGQEVLLRLSQLDLEHASAEFATVREKKE